MKNFILLFLIFITVKVNAQINGKMFRQPDVSKSQITFVYAGDIWIVAKQGGIASKLSSPAGEESFPKFSPDGKQIAFSGNYDGNTDIYTIPTTGGIVKRLTYHPMPDRMLDWYPDGSKILFASMRKSGRARFNQIYSIDKNGGFANKIGVPYGEFAALSPDAKILAYMPQTRDFRTWKRYRGGGASEIWLFNLKTNEAENITKNDAIDGHPMWYKNYIYFLSDRGKNQRANIWRYNRSSKEFKQITFFKDFDITFPSAGPEDIVFEAGGKIYLLNFETEKFSQVNIRIISDFATLKPHQVNVSNMVNYFSSSPDAKRLFLNARGEIFNVPSENGFTKNITQTSGVAELYPAWSPNGKSVAYWSDRSGEFQLVIRNADGSGKEKVVSDFDNGFRYQLFWSPNSKKIAFIDNQNYMKIYDLDDDDFTTIDRQVSLTHPALSGFKLDWSPDSKWITYSKEMKNAQSAIFIYDVENNETHQVTSSFYDCTSPVFDVNGKYLFFISSRTLYSTYSSIDATWIYANTQNIVAVPLTAKIKSPLFPKNDEVKIKESSNKKSDKKKDLKKKNNNIKIDFNGFENRLVVLPIKAGNYSFLSSAKGKVIYLALPPAGSGMRNYSIKYFDLEKRKEMTLLANGSGFKLSANGKKIIVNKGRGIYVLDIRPNQKLKKPIDSKNLFMTLNPRSEWNEMFVDTWRRYRDFFYDENMQGVDWNKMKEQYFDLLQDAVTRYDVNFVIGNLIAEVNSSHTYVFGGDNERAKRVGTGLLGIDWSLENGAYRIKKIINGAEWDSEIRSPLAENGLNVKEGDYILAVNNIPIDTDKEPYAAFEGLARKTIELTINNKPTLKGAHKIIVKTLSSEMRLRNLAWINSNRKWIDEYSNHKVGYIYMPNTGGNGQTELIRQYYGQLDKEAFIIDERFNSGGQLPDRFIELLKRDTGHFIQRRNGPKWKSFKKSNPGPKVMLINGWSVSGGDAFPYVFKSEKVGPIVGTKTAGGLIGPATSHKLIDGGGITVPGGRIYGKDGKWFPESWGVEPDIKIIADPSILVTGTDPQIKAAVDEALRLLKLNPPKKYDHPPFEDKTAGWK